MHATGSPGFSPGDWTDGCSNEKMGEDNNFPSSLSLLTQVSVVHITIISLTCMLLLQMLLKMVDISPPPTLQM